MILDVLAASRILLIVCVGSIISVIHVVGSIEIDPEVLFSLWRGRPRAAKTRHAMLNQTWSTLTVTQDTSANDYIWDAQGVTRRETPWSRWSHNNYVNCDGFFDVLVTPPVARSNSKTQLQPSVPTLTLLPEMLKTNWMTKHTCRPSKSRQTNRHDFKNWCLESCFDKVSLSKYLFWEPISRLIQQSRAATTTTTTLPK